jgi:hypothetical protein
MIRLFVLTILILGIQAEAKIESVVIDNVVRLGPQTLLSPMLLEVCGRVKADEPFQLTIVSDPNSPRLAPYTILTDENGGFCHLVASFSGRLLAIAKQIKDDGETEKTSEIFEFKK